ncbi:2'-N-acetylparomamine deacetylase [Anaerolineaceae bacterium]|nr:2'-N-acetylparomamine deacetylase [Anaerolineaceae bacterium]
MVNHALQHVLLSPHFDDVVFSCGALVAQWARSGQRVAIVTVCAGLPPAGPLSAYASKLHRRWNPQMEGRPAQIVALRRAEDLRAADLLGAMAIHLTVPDCIYRLNPDGGWLYEGHAQIFGALHAAEQQLPQQLAQQLVRISGVTADTRIWIPLALGNHVDHQLVRSAAQQSQLPGVRGYYEDYPYAEDTAAVAGITLPSPDLAAQALSISAQSLEAKLAAISAYESQLSSFWTDGADMRRRVTDYALLMGAGALAERMWMREAM